MKKTFYFVYLGCGTDLLFTEDGVVVNNFAESQTEYGIFEGTAVKILQELEQEICCIELSEEHQSVVQEMLEEEMSIDNDVDEKRYINYILKHGTRHCEDS